MIILFGIGNIAEKTIIKYKLDPKKILLTDNSKILWNKEWNNIKIINPIKLKSIKFSKLIICTTSYNEVLDQLKAFRINLKKIKITKVLDEYRLIDKIEKLNFDLIFVSGLPSIKKNNLGGGAYRIKGNFNKYKISKIYSGNCHGLVKSKNHIYLSDVNNGLVKLTFDGKIISQIKIKHKLRPHGIIMKNNKTFYLALSDDDSIIKINSHGEILDKFEIVSNNQKDKFPRHHINDIMFDKENILLSLFSINGTWKSGKFDGGILSYNLKKRKFKKIISGLIMPHSIHKYKGKIYVCNSFKGELINLEKKIIFKSNGFLRGLDIKKNILITCESKNRNFSNIKDSPLNSSLDTRINFIDIKTGVYKSIQLPNNISEIHSIRSLEINN